jgi:hypothetical protein
MQVNNPQSKDKLYTWGEQFISFEKGKARILVKKRACSFYQWRRCFVPSTTKLMIIAIKGFLIAFQTRLSLGHELAILNKFNIDY